MANQPKVTRNATQAKGEHTTTGRTDTTWPRPDPVSKLVFSLKCNFKLNGHESCKKQALSGLSVGQNTLINYQAQHRSKGDNGSGVLV